MRTKIEEKQPPLQIIRVENLKLRAKIGWYERERAHPQGIVANLSLTTPLLPARISDDLKDTINYEEVISLIEDACQKHEWKLIEHLEWEVARLLFQRFSQIERLSLTVTKDVFTQTSGVSVELICSRADVESSI